MERQRPAWLAKVGEEQVRSPQIIFVIVVLAVTVLPSISAMARNATYLEPRYAGGYCYFGYLGGENKPDCAPSTSCQRRRTLQGILPGETISRVGGLSARRKLSAKCNRGVSSYFTAVEIDPNVVLRLVPTPFTAAMRATAMPDAMRPYSMAVAPDSSLRKAANFRRIIQTQMGARAIYHYEATGSKGS
jgi:hypothetical protein